MVVYWGKRFDAERVGQSEARVVCEKCGCEYFYLLSRMGSGAASAPYGVGSGGAAESAARQSEHDLEHQLATEADLVPCPKCHWINDELVRGYRRGLYHGLILLAMLVAIFGTVISLLCAWVFANGSLMDRWLTPYFLIGGPVLSITLAAGVVLLRLAILSRVRPNRNFPSPPRLPAGSPPALVRDPSGRLVRAHPEAAGDTDDWCEFSIGSDPLPRACCLCLREPPGNEAFAVTHSVPLTATVKLELPLCEACARQHSRAYWKSWWFAFAVCLALIGGAAWMSRRAPEVMWILIVAGSLMGMAIAAVAASIATNPIRDLRVDAKRGVARLRLRVPGYGRAIRQPPGFSQSITAQIPPP